MKNRNIRIRPIYKTLALGALVALAGCKRKIEHKNVVMFVDEEKCGISIYIHDIETGADRVYRDYCDADNMHRYLKAGDTVSIKTAKTETFYDTRKVLNKRRVDFVYNEDTLSARHGREINNLMNERLGKTR